MIELIQPHYDKAKMLVQEFNIDDKQLEALKAVSTQECHYQDICAMVCTILASGFFDAQKVIDAFTAGVNPNLVYDVFQISINIEIQKSNHKLSFRDNLFHV